MTKKPTKEGNRHKHGRPNAQYQTCSLCNKDMALLRKWPQAFKRGEETILIENVPTMGCDNCGQTYFDLATARRIDEVLLHPDTNTEKKLISVASFD